MTCPDAATIAPALKPCLGRRTGTQGPRRHRVFAYQHYLDILSEGTQPL